MILLGKSLWRFMKENGILWWRVIVAKFGTVDRRWYSIVLTRLHEKVILEKCAWVGINSRIASGGGLALVTELTFGKMFS